WTTVPPTSPTTPAGGLWTTPLPPALHAHARVLAEPGGAVLFDPGPPAAQTRRVHLCRGPGGPGDGVDRRLQPHRHAVPLDLRRPTPQGQLICQQLTRGCTSVAGAAVAMLTGSPATEV